MQQQSFSKGIKSYQMSLIAPEAFLGLELCSLLFQLAFVLPVRNSRDFVARPRAALDASSRSIAAGSGVTARASRIWGSFTSLGFLMSAMFQCWFSILILQDGLTSRISRASRHLPLGFKHFVFLSVLGCNEISTNLP